MKVECICHDVSGKVIERTGICENCGAKLDLLHTDGTGAVDCGCGAIYNWAGQRLLPRNQWEEPLDEEY